MKSTLLIIVLIMGTAFPSFAQESKPEIVHSIIKVYKDYEWYVNQSEQWEKYVQKNKKDREAWVNYYAAVRYAKITSPDDEIKEDWRKKMGLVIERMEKSIPKTYEYYYIKTWDSSIWEGKTEEEQTAIASYALNAYKMNPERPDVYPDLVNYYMVKDYSTKLKEVCIKWEKSGDISPNVYALNYNMLMSTKQNAILLTAGDNDTYPALVLQNARNIRTDVSVINIYVAAFSAEYRNNIFKHIGIPALPGDDLKQTDVINYLIENKGDLPLYFAFGGYFNGMGELKDNLYNVGLAMRYSEEDFNNTSILINNFENKFLIDHLKLNLFSDPFPEQVKRHNMSYLPGLIMLYDHYKIVENTKKQEITLQLILDIVSGTPHEETVRGNLGC